MNKTLRKNAIAILLDLLLKCNEKERHMFKRMYAPNNLGMPINEAVNLIHDDNISHAITQCENTIFKKPIHKNLYINERDKTQIRLFTHEVLDEHKQVIYEGISWQQCQDIIDLYDIQR